MKKGDKILGVTKDKIVSAGITTSAGAGVGAVAGATAATDGNVELGIKPLGKIVLTDQELTMQHALAETMSESIAAHAQAPTTNESFAANKSKAIKATAIDEGIEDYFYEKFSPTPTKVKVAAEQMKLQYF